jgi:tRNA threonylcarbamoyladenosine modification (KEOPS) complex Cgi121 subunit
MITVRCLGHIGTALGSKELAIEASEIAPSDLVERVRGATGKRLSLPQRRSRWWTEQGSCLSPSHTAAEAELVFARAYRFGEGTDSQEVKSRLLAANPGSLVQVAKPGSVRNEWLAQMLAAQTFRAQSSGTLLANKPEMDLLLRLAGTTQISKAIVSYGAPGGKAFVAINASRAEIVVPEDYAGAELPRKNLSSTELAKIEKAALLSARRG